MSEFAGTVTNVTEVPIGSVLAEDVAAGAGALKPADPDEFDPQGRLQIGAEVHAYELSGEELELDGTLASSYEEGEPILVWPRAVDRWAFVREAGCEEELQVRVPYALWDRIPLGVRDEDGEEVRCELELDGTAVITDVVAREPRVDGGFIAPHTARPEVVSDGEPPASSPTPEVRSGVGTLIVRWPAVSNHDPVTYEVHVSSSSGFTPGAGTKAAEIQGTVAFIDTLPNGAPFVGGTTYYVKIVARDIDGAAAPSPQGAGEITVLNSANVPSDGQAPPKAATPTLTAGPGILFAEWAPVANADPVVYRVHVLTSQGATPAAGNFYAATSGTAMVIARQPNGSPLDPGTAYCVKVIAEDADGQGPASDASALVAPNKQITETLIANDSISTPKLQANAVVAGKIAANAVTADTIATNAVTASKILASAVTADKIAANAVTADKILANEALFELLQTVLLVSNKIAVPGTSGQRLELDQDGLRLFSSDGEPVVDLDTTTGSALISGNFAPQFEAPSIRQSASAKSTNSASSISPTFSSPSISGNALIAVIIGFNGFSAAAPSGWRIVGEIEDGNGAILRIYERLEASSVSQATFPTNNAFCLAHMFELDGVAPGSLDVVDVKRETDFFNDGITSPSIGPGFPPTQPGFTLATFAAFRLAGNSDPDISSPSPPFTLARSTGWDGADANLRLATFGAPSDTEPQECGVTTTGSFSVLMGLITVKARAITEPDRPRLITRPDPPAFGASIASAASFVPIPRPSCKLYRATSQSIASGTLTAVEMSAPQWDTAGMFASSAPTRITIPRAGTYLLDAYVRWEAVGGGQRLRMDIRRNGAQILTGQDFSSSVGASGQSCATVARLSEGDYLELLVHQNTGGPVGIDDATLAAVWIGD